MDITLQYFDGCPNWETTAADLRDLIEERHFAAQIQYQLIETQESAMEYEFRGSPTVLIDGVDPFANPDAPVGLSCRLHMTPEGLAGSPTRDQLLEALLAADQ